jgi:hypothetical protein
MSDLVSSRSSELHYGKSLVVAVLLAAAGAILVFALARAFFIDQDFVGSIYENGIPRTLAGFVFLAFPYLHQRLERKRRSNFSHLPDEAVPLEGYTLPFNVVFTYGVLIAFAIAGLGLLLVWMVGLVTGFFLTRVISISNWVILLITFYYVGFWSGTRNTRGPFLTASGIVLGYSILEILISLMLGIDSPLRSTLGLLVFLIPYLIAALVGARNGQRRRLSSYVHFLLAPLPEKARQTLVDHLYGEVKQQTRNEH